MRMILSFIQLYVLQLSIYVQRIFFGAFSGAAPMVEMLFCEHGVKYFFNFYQYIYLANMPILLNQPRQQK